MNYKEVLEEAVERQASDVHLKVGSFPCLRIEGRLEPLEALGRVSAADTSDVIDEILTPHQMSAFEATSELDLSLALEDLGRFRMAVYQQRGSIAIVFRLIPDQVPTIEELNLPSALETISDSMRGLVLVTGITGSGKSTTMAAMIRYLNERRACHILTIEDPIEFLFHDDRALISQREVSSDTVSFASALRAGMRQDPDVIMVGEMRDLETMAIALQAAQTGHLVISTLHTTDAVSTLDRIISLYPIAQQRDVRLQVAGALNAIVSIRLIRSSFSDRRIPAVEILRATDLIRSLVADAQRSREIKSAIETGFRDYGMQTFDQSILQHVLNGLISEEDALQHATSPADLKLKIKGISPSPGTG